MVRKGATLGNVSGYEQHSEYEDDEAMASTVSLSGQKKLTSVVSCIAWDYQTVHLDFSTAWVVLMMHAS